jgi:2-polyprenyl-3-methyl-5-hydroxy-6-metoxy-1,4-benzoquinol methylase
MKREQVFDAAISTEVVEHLFAPHLLPRFARETLRPAGYLIISTPYHGYVKNLVLSILDKWDFHHGPLWHGGHIKFWSRRTLSLLLEQNGFKMVEFHGVGRLPFLWKSMILVARKT